jgi:hypothetical protein
MNRRDGASVLSENELVDTQVQPKNVLDDRNCAEGSDHGGKV